MKISKSIFGTHRLVTGLLALILMVGVMPTTAHAQGRFGGRGFGPGFGHGLGWGLGFGIGNALVYSTVNHGYYYNSPVVYTTAAPAQVYYIQQPAPQTVVYAPAPALVAAPAPIVQVTQPAAPATGNKLSKIVYDANGKPIGVLLLNADGSQEFVGLAK